MVTRNPDQTRESLLQAAFGEIYQHGYNAARVDRILENTNVTKGAFYHHFPTKAALGYAVLDEVIRARILALWVEPLADSGDPISTLIETCRKFAKECSDEGVRCGCPLSNLAQEMSPVDERFREGTQSVFDAWRKAVRDALDEGKRAGVVDADADSAAAALFLVASVQGAIGLTKNSRDRSVFDTCMKSLESYLETLRPRKRERR